MKENPKSLLLALAEKGKKEADDLAKKFMGSIPKGDKLG